MMAAIWKLHGDGRSVAPGRVVRPDERLRMPNMLGLGAQHVLAMFGATALVPVLTGFPVTTTIFFSGIGTLLFCLLTRNRVPSYTGSSFAFIAPVLAAKAHGGIPAALGGILVAGVALFLIGLIIDRAGYRVIEFLLPPVVTGLDRRADRAQPRAGREGRVHRASRHRAGDARRRSSLIGVALRGLPRRGCRCSLGVVVGYVFAGDRSARSTGPPCTSADWVGFPDFTHAARSTAARSC